MEIDKTRNSLSDEENIQIQFEESSSGFNAEIMIPQDLISRIKSKYLSLKKEDVFKIPNLLSRSLRRKNEIFWFTSTSEMHVDVKEAKGNVYLPLITKSEINKNLSKIDESIRRKISVVHLGAIKILLKSEFQEGIDSPIKMALIDNRINDRKDCILGAARGNLIYQKFMFTVFPKFGLSLQSQNLDKVLSFYHEFERHNLMNNGDKLFSITYLVAYALSNSHHSIDYMKKEYIELEDVFSEIGKIEEKNFASPNPIDSSWILDISRNKKLIGNITTPKVENNRLIIGTSKDSLVEISNKIDNLETTLRNLTEDV